MTRSCTPPTRRSGSCGAAVPRSGVIDLFENTEERGSQRVEQRTVRVDQRGIVVSANLID